ncbi:MAG: hypothetical protein J3K34DRAFT_266042 [Monoraphidium minutum]|nr:MAG: hypothetical protein J3K34DRAFT_266042 [Monoraphidium minutum]
MQLSASRVGLALGAPRVRVSSSSRALVVVRAKELREYREDSDQVINSKQEAPKDGQPLYADQVKAAKKGDNMSKEMKARLRKEYVGFGGAENTAMGNNYFLWIAVTVAVLAVMSKMIGAI